MEIILKVTFMSGPCDGKCIEISLNDNISEATIGRSEDCDICIPDDAEISRKHARLYCKEHGLWLLEDLNSTNGTYLGEFFQAKRITLPVELSYGHIFKLGRTSLKLESPVKVINEF